MFYNDNYDDNMIRYKFALLSRHCFYKILSKIVQDVGYKRYLLFKDKKKECSVEFLRNMLSYGNTL